MEADLAWMRAFAAVADELHFGRAALRLGLSQPQVSRQVRALEDALAVELFVRTPRRTELTEAGRRLLPDVRETLTAADRVRTRAADLRRGTGGKVSVGFLWSTLSGYVPRLVAGAAERCPGIELSVAQMAFLEVLPALRRGDVDLVFARPLNAEHELIESLLTVEPLLLALPAGHPLAAEGQIGLERLPELELIVFHRELVPTAYDAAIRRAREAGIEPRIVRHVRSASEALALVSAGVGVYLIAASAAAPFPGVVYRELTGLRSRVMLLHRPLPDAILQTVIELAHELFADAEPTTPAGERR